MARSSTPPSRAVATTFIWFDNFTLHNIHFVFFELSATKLAMQNTFVLGVAAATIGTVMALVIAYLTTRRAIRGYRALGFLATAPVAIPGIVLGVGLFLSYARPPFVLYGTLWILLIAFVTIALPAAYQQMQSAFRSVHPDLEDASRILGATRLRTLRDITAPLLRTSVIATWCFIFVGVIRELSAAIMLFTSETKVISVLIFDLNECGDLGAIAVLGLIMLRHHLRGRHRRQPHSRLRRRRACAMRDAPWTLSFPRSSVAEIWRTRSSRSTRRAAGRRAREMRGSADRRGRPLPRPRATRTTSRRRSPAGTTRGPAPRSAMRAA